MELRHYPVRTACRIPSFRLGDRNAPIQENIAYPCIKYRGSILDSQYDKSSGGRSDITHAAGGPLQEDKDAVADKPSLAEGVSPHIRSHAECFFDGGRVAVRD